MPQAHINHSLVFLSFHLYVRAFTSKALHLALNNNSDPQLPSYHHSHFGQSFILYHTSVVLFIIPLFHCCSPYSLTLCFIILYYLTTLQLPSSIIYIFHSWGITSVPNAQTTLPSKSSACSHPFAFSFCNQIHSFCPLILHFVNSYFK